MVDDKRKELASHGKLAFPVATYNWYSPSVDGIGLECHWHNEWEFFRMTQGQALFSVEGEKELISEGDIAFVPKGRMHMAEAVQGMPFKYKAVVFNLDFLNGFEDIIQTKYILPLIERKISVKHFYSNGRAPRLISLFDELISCLDLQNPPPAYELRCKALIFEMMAVVLQSEKNVPTGSVDYGCIKGIKSAMSYIHENYAAQINVEELAKIAQLSTGYFTRMFKKYTSKPPIDYVKWVRLSNAARLLRSTDEKLITIALETGFNNLSYFTRCFGACFGCPPNEYRRQNAGN